MSIVDELIAAIESDPSDEAAQLVIADYLQADGDPRGDLIVLDHAERRGLLDDPAALEQLLLLAAAYSFPRAAPDDPPLPFRCRRRQPTEYELLHDDHIYTLEYDEGGWDARYQLRVRGVDAHEDEASVHAIELELAEPWTDEQARVVLAIISDAIRAWTPLDDLHMPYRSMPLPQYEGSPLRCYLLPLEFLIPRGLLRNRYGLAARDYHRWHAIWNRLRAMQRG